MLFIFPLHTSLLFLYFLFVLPTYFYSFLFVNPNDDEETFEFFFNSSLPSFLFPRFLLRLRHSSILWSSRCSLFDQWHLYHFLSCMFSLNDFIVLIVITVFIRWYVRPIMWNNAKKSLHTVKSGNNFISFILYLSLSIFSSVSFHALYFTALVKFSLFTFLFFSSCNCKMLLSLSYSVFLLLRCSHTLASR